MGRLNHMAKPVALAEGLFVRRPPKDVQLAFKTIETVLLAPSHD